VALVWLVLPWLNVVVRDGGRFEWEMPGPVLWSGVVGSLLAVVGGLVGSLVGDVEALGWLAMVMLCTLYGCFIGWLSTLCRPA
jgi:hypothetical protein